MAKRILLVDDEPLIIKGLKYTLEQEGFETDSAADGEEALSVFRERWIPLENRYFTALDILSQCDLVVDAENS